MAPGEMTTPSNHDTVCVSELTWVSEYMSDIMRSLEAFRTIKKYMHSLGLKDLCLGLVATRLTRVTSKHRLSRFPRFMLTND